MTTTSGSGAYRIDGQTVITPAGEAVMVAPRQADVLSFLHAHRGRAFTQEELIESVWGYGDCYPDNVRIAILELRRRVAPDVVDTVPLYTPARGGPKKCGYSVGEKS